MARNKFSLNFDGFLDLARQVDELGEGLLKTATENALTKSADYANTEVLNAMEKSKYAFTKGERSDRGVGGYSDGSGVNRGATGRAKESAIKTSKLPLEWVHTTAIEYIGVSWYDAPEVTLLAFGTPHIQADKTLQNAIKVKGKVRKEVNQIQKDEFLKIIEEFGNG